MKVQSLFQQAFKIESNVNIVKNQVYLEYCEKFKLNEDSKVTEAKLSQECSCDK
jgi:hypothetical protein